jgi:Zn-dependent metalloprotease
VNRYADLFAPGASTLVLSGIQDVMRGKFTAVYFQQVVDGIPVDKGELTLLVREVEGHPLVLASSAVRFVAPVDTAPKLDADAAIQIAQKLRPDLHADTKPELVIYPAEEETHLAWAFSVDCHSLEKPERYRVFVDAHTGANCWSGAPKSTTPTSRVRRAATRRLGCAPTPARTRRNCARSPNCA